MLTGNPEVSAGVVEENAKAKAKAKAKLLE